MLNVRSGIWKSAELLKQVKGNILKADVGLSQGDIDKLTDSYVYKMKSKI